MNLILILTLLGILITLHARHIISNITKLNYHLARAIKFINSQYNVNHTFVITS